MSFDDLSESKVSFENAYIELSSLVKKMESGELSLEESVSVYERGIKLKQYCESLLKEAELKISVINPVSE